MKNGRMMVIVSLAVLMIVDDKGLRPYTAGSHRAALNRTSDGSCGLTAPADCRWVAAELNEERMVHRGRA